jgi:hypothetical protein
MAVSYFDSAPSNATDTSFRAWGKGLSDALAAVGMIKTSDTGQIDWTSVLKPSAAATSQGYEMWRFSDSLQSETPVYIKIQYGSGYSSVYNFGISITVGKATDGAGEFIGERSSEKIIYATGYTTSTYTTYVSGSTDRLSICLFRYYTYNALFIIERTKNSSGANTSVGVDIIHSAKNSSSINETYQQFLPKNGLRYPYISSYIGCCCAFPYNATTAVYGDTIGLFPIFTLIGGAHFPSLGGLVYFSGDITANTDVSITMLGSAHTYKATGVTIATINGNANAKSIAMRYE